MSNENGKKTGKSAQSNGRNALLLVAGIVVLGLALALIIFGGTLFGSAEELSIDESGGLVLEQIPEFSPAETTANQLPTGGGPLELGDPAYDFLLDDVNGNPVQLSNFAGQPVIINFWATWCAPCRVEMPELEAAYQLYRDEGLVILALDQQESAEDVSSFFRELGLSFTAVLDNEGTVSELYGVANILPTTFFINGAGEVTAIHRGPMVQSQIDGYLADTLPSAN